MNRIALLGAACIAATSHAQLVVGNDDLTGDLRDNAWLVDINNDTSSVLWQNFPVWGMAYDSATDTIFAGHSSQLGSGRLGSGAPSHVVTVRDSIGDELFMSGYTWAEGQLIGVTNIIDEAFYRIDPQTGEAEMLLNFWDFDYDFGGMAYNEDDGLFYLTDDDSTPDLGLHTIDLFGDGEINYIAPYPNDELDVDGLAIGNGVAYLVTDEPGLIYTYDIATGTYGETLTNPMQTTEVISGATFVPAPGSLALLGLGAMVGMRRRR